MTMYVFIQGYFVLRFDSGVVAFAECIKVGQEEKIHIYCMMFTGYKLLRARAGVALGCICSTFEVACATSAGWVTKATFSPLWLFQYNFFFIGTMIWTLKKNNLKYWPHLPRLIKGVVIVKGEKRTLKKAPLVVPIREVLQVFSLLFLKNEGCDHNLFKRKARKTIAALQRRYKSAIPKVRDMVLFQSLDLFQDSIVVP